MIAREGAVQEIDEMWYAVNLLFAGTNKDKDSEALWEERIVLVRAESDEAALAAAGILAREGEHEYESRSGTIRWEFKQVERLFPIDGEIRSGIEVFSRFLRDSEVKSLLEPFE